jgi:hypothetical protein
VLEQDPITGCRAGTVQITSDVVPCDLTVFSATVERSVMEPRGRREIGAGIGLAVSQFIP